MEEVTPDYRSGKGRADAANAHSLRIEAVIDLASAIECDQFYRPDGAHEDLIDYLAMGWNQHCDQSMKPLFDAAGRLIEDEVDEEEIAGAFAMRGLYGYVVQFALPVYLRATEDSTSYSWGHYRSKWIYADRIEDAWSIAVDWAKRHKAEAIQETAAKATK